jgi:light-harvesting complex II chlorophyll a/b binding protein 4
MQLISTLALAASASALVAPVAPQTSKVIRAGATLDDQLKKIPGVSPLKNAPADYGFDPLGFAKVSYPRFGLPEDELLRTNNLRDAELRHGRLAMLAAAAWPIQELAHPSLAKLAGAPELLSDGRSPSILNGGLVAGPVPAFLLATAAAIGYLDVQAEAKKAEYPASDWIPGFGAVSLKMPYI